MGRALVISLLASGVAGVLGPGCAKTSTPEAACESFFAALAEGDAGAAFDHLIESTQWSLATVQKNHRRMRELIESSYPPAEQPAALARLYGASDGSGRELWARLYLERYAQFFAERQGAGAVQVTPSLERPAERLCGREGKKPLRVARAASGRWGIADLDSEWEQAQLRAVHDLDTIQKNADLYKRVQAPSQK